MIEIPLIADVYFPKGETPVLEFEDIRQAEQFALYLQKHIQRVKSKKKQRLEYFSDGIYFDGEYLELSPKLLAILRAFEFTDKLLKSDLIARVWNNPYKNNNSVKSVINRFNHSLFEKGIWIETDGQYYKLHHP